MRIRDTYYENYGFSTKEVKELKEWCKAPDFKEFVLLLECARKVNTAIFNDIYFSIVKGLSYEKMDKKTYQCMSKNDFYGYQRKTLALFRDVLIEKNKYPFGAVKGC